MLSTGVSLVVVPGVKQNPKGAIGIQPQVAWKHNACIASACFNLPFEHLYHLHNAGVFTGSQSVSTRDTKNEWTKSLQWSTALAVHFLVNICNQCQQA